MAAEALLVRILAASHLRDCLAPLVLVPIPIFSLCSYTKEKKVGGPTAAIRTWRRSRASKVACNSSRRTATTCPQQRWESRETCAGEPSSKSLLTIAPFPAARAR